MRKVVLLAKVAMTLGLLGYLSMKIDPSAMLTQIRRSDPMILGAGTVVLGFQPLLGAARWRQVLGSLGVPLSFALTVRCTYVSVFFGQLLPVMIGADALRVWLVHNIGCRLRTAVVSVGLDRVMLLVSMVALMTVSVPLLARLLRVNELLYLMPILLGGSMLGLLLLMMGDRLPASLKRRPILREVAYLARAARGLFLNPKFAGTTMALSLISHISITVSVYLFTLAFEPRAQFLDFLVLIPPVLACSMLPISIGGWGTRELAMVGALATVSIAADTAVLAAVWLGFASILIALPGAALYFIDRRSPKSAPIGSQRSVNP